MHIGFQLARIIGVLALAAAMAGCSTVKLGYNSLPEIAYWWLDGYVDFSESQAPRVREDLARLQLWHREQELPRYTELLHKMELLAPADITAAQACEFSGAIRERLNALAAQAEPAATLLAMELGTEQLQHLVRKYRNNNNDYRKEWLELTPGELRDKRYKQFLERSEMVYGRLDEAQRILLRRQLEQSAFDPRRNLAQRQRRQDDALQTLRKMATPGLALSQARDLLRGYLARALDPPDTAARREQEQLIEEACRNVAAVHNSASAAQRDAAVRRLRAWQRDLRELAAQR
ncbi:DUF6279 family lipoprotein [uncultured Ramlibacter sp.]|uniref:DUF6279 family lipoprotein n=1 Tax=uncultured Ramlibacter sp. TaxID=260755 RepID=UPI00261D1E89|nr:DUF6279 family lipoprotein [uncultured Ramlibacter sp.]